MGVIMKNGINYSGGGMPGQGYTGSDLILRDPWGNINGVWYVDSHGTWTEYTTGGGGGEGGHSFGLLVPNAMATITNSFSFEEVTT